MLELFKIAGKIELDGGEKVSRQLDGIDGKARSITRGIRNFARRVGEVAAGIGVFALVSKGIDMVKRSLDGAIDRYDTLNNFPRVMQQLGFDASSSDKSIQRLSDGIQGLPTRLDEVAKTAQNIAIMTQDLDGATETTLALNNAFLASGASQQDAARGLEQYVQMLAKGEVDLQSWRTLQETMGLALNQLAKDFGFTGASAQNDLYDALKEGEITFDEFNNALIEASNRTGGFAEMAQTSSGGIKTAWTNMKTWIVTGVTDIIGAIDEALGGTGSLEGAINNLKPVVQGFFGWISNTAIPTVATWIQNIITWLDEWRTNNSETLRTIQQTISEVFNQIVGFLQTFWQGLLTFWQEHGQTLVENAIIVFSEIWETVQTVFSAVQTIIEQVIGYIVPWVQEKISFLREFWEENGEQITQAVQNAFEFIRSIIEFIMPAVQFIIEMVWGTIRGIFDGALNAILGLVKIFTGLFTGDWSKLWEGVKQLLSGALELIWNLLNFTFIGRGLGLIKNFGKAGLNLFRNFGGGIRNVFSNIMSFVNNIVSRLVNVVLNFFRRMTSGVRSSVSNVFSVIRNTFTRIINFITGLGKKFFDAGKKIVTSIADGIKNAIGSVTGAITGVADKIRGFLPFSPAKEGPLSDLDKLDFKGPITKSIEGAEHQVQAKMAHLLTLPSANTRNDTMMRQVSDNSEVVSLLKELIQAVKEGKIMQVNDTVFAELVGDYADSEGGNRIRRIERGLA